MRRYINLGLKPLEEDGELARKRGGRKLVRHASPPLSMKTKEEEASIDNNINDKKIEPDFVGRNGAFHGDAATTLRSGGEMEGQEPLKR
jgi:hypothetical protein